MSDPRASISRTVLAPPIAPSSPAEAGAESSRGGVKLIGKQHGRMRCVNLSLTAEAKETLYSRSVRDGVTLGEALMDALDQSSVPATARRPGRQNQLRRGVATVSVYVLLVPAEATDLLVRADRAGRSISDYASRALSK